MSGIEVRLVLKPYRERVKKLRKLLDRIEEELRRGGYSVIKIETKTDRYDWVEG